jgi:hypothetical protein
MKREEQIVRSYLESTGEYKILYEPDGNIPPDFTLNGEIAVEVRRLNQNILIGNKLIPVEDLDFNLIPKLEKLFKDITVDNYTQSIFVSVRYQRPLVVTKELLKEVKNRILESLQLLNKEMLVEINSHLSLKLYRSSLKLDDYISIGAISDLDTGGFIVEIMRQNIGVAISEKDEKVKPYLNLYKTWWLILVDYVGFGLNDIDYQQINSRHGFETVFDKVLIVSSLDFKNSHELLLSKACA